MALILTEMKITMILTQFILEHDILFKHFIWINELFTKLISYIHYIIIIYLKAKNIFRYMWSFFKSIDFFFFVICKKISSLIIIGLIIITIINQYKLESCFTFYNKKKNKHEIRIELEFEVFINNWAIAKILFK